MENLAYKRRIEYESIGVGIEVGGHVGRGLAPVVLVQILVVAGQLGQRRRDEYR